MYNLNLLLFMKAVREYKTEGDHLFCTVTFLPDQQDLDKDPDEFEELEFSPLYLSALVSYPFKPGETPNTDDASFTRRLQVNGSPNISPAVVISETVRFCQTLKQMYDL